MRLLLASCVLFLVFVGSVSGQENEKSLLFPPPQLSVEPTSAPNPAAYETVDETVDVTVGNTNVQPFEQRESYVMPDMEVQQTEPVAHQQQQLPRRRRVYRRYYVHSDPHQVEYYSPSLPYYDPAHGYNSYRPLPANSRHYRGRADRHNTGWGFGY